MVLEDSSRVAGQVYLTCICFSKEDERPGEPLLIVGLQRVRGSIALRSLAVLKVISLASVCPSVTQLPIPRHHITYFQTYHLDCHEFLYKLPGFCKSRS
jgi:hypothetical protein